MGEFKLDAITPKRNVAHFERRVHRDADQLSIFKGDEFKIRVGSCDFRPEFTFLARPNPEIPRLRFDVDQEWFITAIPDSLTTLHE